MAVAGEPEGEGSRPPEEREEAQEPEFLRNLDRLTPEDLERWREIDAQVGHPLRKIARLTLERWEKGEARRMKNPLAPPAKDSRGGLKIEASCACPGDYSQSAISGQDKEMNADITSIISEDTSI